MFKIIALIGESGAGKDTLMQEFLKTFPDEFNEIISCTTRPKRENEIDGKNYFFLTEEEFEASEMFETTCFNDWYYGTPAFSLSKEKINIGVFNIEGIQQLKRSEEISLIVCRVECRDKTRLIRQLNREENPNVEEIIRRYSTDKEDFKEENLNFKYHSLFNEDKTDLLISIIQIRNLIKTYWNQDKID